MLLNCNFALRIGKFEGLAPIPSPSGGGAERGMSAMPGRMPF